MFSNLSPDLGINYVYSIRARAVVYQQVYKIESNQYAHQYTQD